MFDNIFYTLLNDKGKSKYNLGARKDLRELGICSKLWPDNNDKYAQQVSLWTVVGNTFS